MFPRNIGKFSLYTTNKSKSRPSPDAHKIWIRSRLLSFQSNNRDIHTKAFWIYSVYFTVYVLSHGIIRWTCSSTRHGNLDYVRSSEASPRNPPPTTRYSGKYLGSTAHSILIILILNLLETGQHPRKILSCKFIHLKLRTLMKKSDCTSRITSWIQKIHSPRTLVITFGIRLTERRAEEKQEYGYIPFGVKTHRSQFG